jgi:hypothetical protein
MMGLERASDEEGVDVVAMVFGDFAYRCRQRRGFMCGSFKGFMFFHREMIVCSGCKLSPMPSRGRLRASRNNLWKAV